MSEIVKAELAETATVSRDPIGPWQAVRRVLEPIASLKLTVGLLILGVVVILIFTFETTHMGIWKAKSRHFPDLIVHIPFQHLLPPAWFPNHQDIPGGFYFPSGFAVLLAMLTNLLSAHLIRFRVQSTGPKLWVGAATIVMGLVLCTLVVINGQNSDGFQAKPIISWGILWGLIQAGFAMAAIVCIVGAFTMKKEKLIERSLLGIAGITMAFVFGFLFSRGRSDLINDSGMRILWQLVQCGAASLLLLSGCVLVFRRKAGIFVLHFGLALLMANEIFYSLTAIEQRMQIFEGETAHFAIDLRSTELAVIDITDPEFDEVVTYPAHRLKAGEIISPPQIPFDIEIEEYFGNCVHERWQPGQKKWADVGPGRIWGLISQPLVPGTGDEVDRPGAYVRILERKSGESEDDNDEGPDTNLPAKMVLGQAITFITDSFASRPVENSDFEMPQNVVHVGEKQYRVELRYKRFYKPYSITLIDVDKTDYLGTTTPKSFSSEFQLVDSETGVDSRQIVSMNDPLRYRDETFYQTNFRQLPSGEEATEMQVVKNDGWMVPYLCCVLVGFGLIYQFLTVLLGVIKKQNVRAKKEILSAIGMVTGYGPVVAAVDVATKNTSVEKVVRRVKRKKDELIKSAQTQLMPSREVERSQFSRRVSLGLIVLMLLMIGGRCYKTAKPKEVTFESMRLDQFGDIPLSYNGRILPLDSLARNTLRQFSGRESAVDNKGDSQPAIRWLADTAFQREGYKEYQIFRIDNPALRAALKLPRRKRYRYSLKEIEKKQEELDQQITDADGTPELTRTVYQKKTLELAIKIRKFRELERLFHLNWDGEHPVELYLRQAAVDGAAQNRPMLAPMTPGKIGWNRFSIGVLAETAMNKARETGVETYGELAKSMIDEDIEIVREHEVRLRMFQQVVEDPEMRRRNPNMSQSAFENMLLRRIMTMPEKDYEFYSPPYRRQVIADDVRVRLMYSMRLAEDLKSWFGQKQLPSDAIDYSVSNLAGLREAYLADDAEKFNELTSSYVAGIHETPPYDFQSWQLSWEGLYNRLAPFVTATAIYLMGFIFAAFSLVCCRRTMNAMAFWTILFGAMVHLTGIVLRVGISERPPVTNLYSTFVFISLVFIFVMLVLELFTRMSIGNMLAAIFGIGSLLWAWGIAVQKGDTIAVMQAVLDTNFWLSTHVICISLGYAATMVAGMLGVVYLLGRIFTPSISEKGGDIFSRAIYGITCFAMLFSFVGTVLGGLWADDSWGRFWGWDPKENGALMIVLWNAAVLHARWSGLAGKVGIAMLAILGNAVTAWSWEGVNQLGVGLHQYGLSEGTLRVLLIFCVVNFSIAACGYIPKRLWISTSRLQFWRIPVGAVFVVGGLALLTYSAVSGAGMFGVANEFFDWLGLSLYTTGAAALLGIGAYLVSNK